MKIINVSKISVVIAALALLSASCNPFASSTSAGFLKTANGGADWQFTNHVKDNAKATMAGLSISAMAFDPKKPEHIFASSYNNGVFYSDDGGDTWHRILSKFLVYDIAVQPQNPDIIYAVGEYANHGRVVVSRDGGRSWNEIFNEASTGDQVRTIALNPNNPREVIIGMNAGAIIKSEDEGVNWRLLQTYNSRINKLRWKNDNSLYAVVHNSGVYVSRDNGSSFSNITSTLTPPSGNLGQLISSAGIGNFNQVAVSENNPSVLFVSTNNGLYKTFNAGATWSFVSLPVRQNNVETLAVSIAPSNDSIVYASAGSTIYRSGDGGASWQAQNTNTTGLPNIILINPQLPQIAFAGIYIP